MSKKSLSLVFVYEKTMEWLKFAEAKNGAILAINCAITFGILRLIKEIDHDYELFLLYIYIALACLTVSIVIALLSFMPRLEPPWWIRFPEKKSNPNILYFGDICTLTPKIYLESFYKVISCSDQYSEDDNQLSNQIVINSKITYIKFKQFNISVWFTIGAILTPVGALIVARLKN